MEMLWPTSLYLLGLIPFIIAVYIWTLRRRRRYAVRYSSLSLVREALPKFSQWRRHLPFAMFILALMALMLAFARPMTTVTVPSKRATIIMAMDVSRSMCSTDIPPNRLAAAKEAALSFVEHQKSTTQIGIVAFAGFAELVQVPTTDQKLLHDAIERLTTARRTAIGSAILKSVEAIAELDSSVAPLVPDSSPGIAPTPRASGDYVPSIVVLLTDGVSNTGPFPLDAAQQATERGVRIYTIGFGTPNPGDLRNCSQFQGSGSNSFDPQFFGGGGGFFRGIDEDTLRQVAKLTGGEYYSASSSSELNDVLQHLPTNLITTQELMEVSVLFTAVGIFFAALAILLSLIWNPLQ